jgi:hypothetical protein
MSIGQFKSSNGHTDARFACHNSRMSGREKRRFVLIPAQILSAQLIVEGRVCLGYENSLRTTGECIVVGKPQISERRRIFGRIQRPRVRNMNLLVNETSRRRFPPKCSPNESKDFVVKGTTIRA